MCRLFHAKIFKMKPYVSIILGYYTFLIAVCVHQSLSLKKEIVRWRMQVCAAVEVVVLFLWFNYPNTSEIATVQNSELSWLSDGTCSPQSQFRNSVLKKYGFLTITILYPAHLRTKRKGYDFVIIIQIALIMLIYYLRTLHPSYYWTLEALYDASIGLLLQNRKLGLVEALTSPLKSQSF